MTVIIVYTITAGVAILAGMAIHGRPVRVSIHSQATHTARPGATARVRNARIGWSLEIN